MSKANKTTQNKPLTDQQTKDAINAEVKRCLTIFQQQFPKNYNDTDWTMLPLGTTKGERRIAFCETNYTKKTYQLYFNMREIAKKQGNLLCYLIRHEIAHGFTRQIFGQEPKPHGKEWKAMCTLLGGEARASQPHDYVSKCKPSDPMPPLPSDKPKTGQPEKVNKTTAPTQPKEAPVTTPKKKRGVIAFIVKQFEEGWVTKVELLEKLVAEFPLRTGKQMKITINCQVGHQLARYKGYIIETNKEQQFRITGQKPVK